MMALQHSLFRLIDVTLLVGVVIFFIVQLHSSVSFVSSFAAVVEYKNRFQYNTNNNNRNNPYTFQRHEIRRQSNDEFLSIILSTSTSTSSSLSSSTSSSSEQQEYRPKPQSDPKQVETILFVECGFGADAHGQNVTKAAIRACRNAIEFNQIPCIGTIIPGGRSEMKLDVLLAIPEQYQYDLNIQSIKNNVFPYGQVNIQIQNGGMIAQHGKIIPEMNDKNEDMIIVCVAVTVGY